MTVAGLPERVTPNMVTIVRAGTTTDRYGNNTPDWTHTTRTDVRAWIQQQQRSEDVTGRDAAISMWLLVVPLGTDITATDRVEYDGATFEVVGPPAVTSTIRGPHHVEATLRAAVG